MRSCLVRNACLVCAVLGFVPGSVADDDVAAVASKIDARISVRWREAEVSPAPAADDAEFLRRVYLDLGGKIPSAMDVREFLADESPSKRREVVDRLLESPGYVAHYSEMLATMLVPETTANLQLQYVRPAFVAWLREQLEENVSYDAIVRELLTITFNNPQDSRMQFTAVSPAAFYFAKQNKPENLAAATARNFLGLRIECAQCHHHPFDTWQQEQFWSLAAFFSSVGTRNPNAVLQPLQERPKERDIKIAGTDRVVPAAFLDGGQPDWSEGNSPREELAEWVIAHPNFGRATVNRLWAQMFGVGIVDSVDDFSPNNAPSHPELLDDLAQAFVDHNYDVKFLLRAIAASQTYQLSSARTHESQDDPRLFAKMNLKGLTSQQLVSSLIQATGYYEPAVQRYQNQFAVINGQQNPKGDLLEAFRDDTPSLLDRQTTIIQALAMMNGSFTATATNVRLSQTLGAILEYPGSETSDRIETLYLATLSRLPRDDEMERLTRFVNDREASKNEREALGHVFWALLNSSEFLFNH